MRVIFLSFSFLALVALSSCRSLPCVCPEIDLPEVVEVPIAVPYLLPIPSLPVFQFCYDLTSVYNNFDETLLKFEECVKIIQANNAEVTE